MNTIYDIPEVGIVTLITFQRTHIHVRTFTHVSVTPPAVSYAPTLTYVLTHFFQIDCGGYLAIHSVTQSQSEMSAGNYNIDHFSKVHMHNITTCTYEFEYIYRRLS